MRLVCLSLAAIVVFSACKKKPSAVDEEQVAGAPVPEQAVEPSEPVIDQAGGVEIDPGGPIDPDGGIRVTADTPARPQMLGQAPAIEPAKTLETRPKPFTIGSSIAHPPTPREPPGLYGPNEVAATAFVRHCGGCHGADGSGETMRQVLPKIPDLTRSQPSEAALRKLIKEGHAQAPPLEKALSSKDLDELVEEIKAMKK